MLIPSGRKSVTPRHSWRRDDNIAGARKGLLGCRAPGSRQPSTETTMIRAIALAIMFGALSASAAVYAISPRGWQDVITPLFGGPDRGAVTAIAPADWPTW